MAAKKTEDDRSLKRLGGGRWQTRDERFTVEPQSGTWVLVDAEQMDDLGLPLVRGPYRSLTEAKAAVEAARGAEKPESPLADRLRQGATAPSATPAATAAEKATGAATTGTTARKASAAMEQPIEPRWIADLVPRDRGRARRLIDLLGKAGVRDAENVVRQDLTGGVPTVARLALANHLAGVLASAGEVSRAGDRALGPLVEAIEDGRDDDLGVRWRLVDGEDRPIGLTSADLRAAIKRRVDAAGKEGTR